jgi:hypothetical protein
MIEIVREYPTVDGIGAMMWKKIYAMSYAYKHKLLFENTPFKGFLIHESDNITNRHEYIHTLERFNNLLFNPWDKINFDDITNKIMSKRVGWGLGITEYGPGFVKEADFLLEAPVFNKIANDASNNIVIHLRRGNAIPKNPRYTHDEFYLNLLSQISIIFEKFNLDKPEVIICTDAPTENKRTFKPEKLNHVSEGDVVYGRPVIQSAMWNQPYLHKDDNGEYPVISANFDEYKKVYSTIKIVNNISTYESFLLMLRAKVLIPANSAFSASAALLSHNRVIGINDAVYRNRVGRLDRYGNLLV